MYPTGEGIEKNPETGGEGKRWLRQQGAQCREAAPLPFEPPAEQAHLGRGEAPAGKWSAQLRAAGLCPRKQISSVKATEGARCLRSNERYRP